MNIIYENDFYKLTIDENTGCIIGLTHKNGNWDIIGEKRLAGGLDAVIPIEWAENNHALASEQRLSKNIVNGDEILLIWDELNTNKAGILNIKVTARISCMPRCIRFSLSVENNCKYTLQEISYPTIGGIRRNKEEEKLEGIHINSDGMYNVFPLDDGFNTNLGYWGIDCPSHLLTYPSKEQAIPYQSVHSGDYGFSILVEGEDLTTMTSVYYPGYTDSKRSRCVTTYTEINGYPTGTIIYPTQLPFITSGKKLDLSPVLISFYTGDWQKENIQVLKSWYAKRRLSGFSPSWLREISCTYELSMFAHGIDWNNISDYISTLGNSPFNAVILSDIPEFNENTSKEIENIRTFGKRVFIKWDISGLSAPCKGDPVLRQEIISKARELLSVSPDGLFIIYPEGDLYCKRTGHSHKINKTHVANISAALKELEPIFSKNNAALITDAFYGAPEICASAVIHSGRDSGIGGVASFPWLSFFTDDIYQSVAVSGTQDFNLINHALGYGFIIALRPGFGLGTLNDIPQAEAYCAEVEKIRKNHADILIKTPVSFKRSGNICRSEFISDSGKQAHVFWNCSDATENIHIPELTGLSVESPGKDTVLCDGSLTLFKYEAAVIIKE